MNNAVLAPSFFSPPDPNQNNWAEHWVNNLLEWKKLLQFALRGYNSTELEQAMMAESLHPLVWIGNYENHFSRQSIQTSDVFKIYKHIFQLLTELRIELEQRGIVEIEMGEVVIEPSDYAVGFHKSVQQSYYQFLLAMTFIASEPNHVMAISFNETRDLKPCVIRSNVTAHLKECDREEIFDRNTEVIVEFVNNPECLLKILDPVEIWISGLMRLDEAACRFAIESNTNLLFYEKLCKDQYLQVRLEKWRFGSAFFIQKDKPDVLYDKGQVKRLLRVFAETIAKESLSEVHALRDGKSGSAAPLIRKRDGAKAMRRTINGACRLHYWEYEGIGLEFANITIEHDDYFISDS